MSKTKDHLKALERRLTLWEQGNISELVNESETIHKRLPSTNTQMNKGKHPNNFKQPMRKANVNGALRLSTNNSNVILPLSDETLQMLSLRHPEVQAHHEAAMLQGTKRQIHSIVYGNIDEDLVKKVEIKTKRGCSPFGLGTDNRCRILVSNQFGSSPLNLQTSITNFVQRLCNTTCISFRFRY